MTEANETDAVLVIGGRGEFGQFLQRDILPTLGARHILTVERDTPPSMRESLLAAIGARPDLRRRVVVDVDPLSVL